MQKKEYCINNNIPMIVVTYWEKDNMEEYIVNKLNEIKISTNN